MHHLLGPTDNTETTDMASGAGRVQPAEQFVQHRFRSARDGCAGTEDGGRARLKQFLMIAFGYHAADDDHLVTAAARPQFGR